LFQIYPTLYVVIIVTSCSYLHSHKPEAVNQQYELHPLYLITLHVQYLISFAISNLDWQLQLFWPSSFELAPFYNQGFAWTYLILQYYKFLLIHSNDWHLSFQYI